MNTEILNNEKIVSIRRKFGFLLEVGLPLIFFFPLFVHASVVFNEIAWMGTSISANDEWIELYNNGSENIDLTGWRIAATDGQPDIAIDATICVNTTISAGGYFLLERTDDETVPGVIANCIYTGALGNAGEELQLFMASGESSDSIGATDGWPAGDNTTKETMQRSGSGWVTASATPKAVNSSTSSSVIPGSTRDPENSQEQGGVDSGSKTGRTSSGNSTGYIPPEQLPHITVSAGKDMRAVVGEEVQLRAEAWGLQDEQLENARYLWNFGDGETKEGKNGGHVYLFPGNYLVRVTASSGKYTAFDDLSVTVTEGSVVVSEVKPGPDGWVELENKTGNTVHVGGWILESKNNQFRVPSSTMIAPYAFAVLSNAVTKLLLQSEGDHLYLFYPNGTYAAGFSYILQVPAGLSVSYQDDTAVFTEPTPGKENKTLFMETEKQVSAALLVPQILPKPVSVKSVSAKTVSQPDRVNTNISSDVPKPTEEIGTTIKNEAKASVFIAEAPKPKKWQEAWWFAGSLVVGGVCAVVVVLWRRRKGQEETDMQM